MWVRTARCQLTSSGSPRGQARILFLSVQLIPASISNEFSSLLRSTVVPSPIEIRQWPIRTTALVQSRTFHPVTVCIDITRPPRTASPGPHISGKPTMSRRKRTRHSRWWSPGQGALLRCSVQSPGAYIAAETTFTAPHSYVRI